VSAIIPCQDRPQLLERALSSVADQAVRPIEVIVVVDDGSAPPRSPSPIRQENRGPAAARDRAIAAASGEWIAPRDSDDTWIPEKIEYQLDLISRCAAAEFCVSTASGWRGNGPRGRIRQGRGDDPLIAPEKASKPGSV
jgi:glycosyltransferase involved in cell wall biosynthesis